MGKKLLNSKSKFKCSFLSGKVIVINIPNRVDCGGDVLTKNTKLQCTGICNHPSRPPVNGVPQPCAFAFTCWESGFDNNKTINGVPVLFEGASVSCPVCAGVKISAESLGIFSPNVVIE